jgi:uncharacterized protein
MDFICGKAAIDLVFHSVKQYNKKKEASVLFFGSAEPTNAWKLFTNLVNYIENISCQTGISSKIGITTNGFLSNTQRQFLANHIDSITLSFDGPEDIQNRQRPTKTGKDSYRRVLETAKYLATHAPNALQITSVITGESMLDLEKIFSFFSVELPGVPLTIETVEIVGRAKVNNVTQPNAKDFLSKWINAKKIIEKNNYPYQWQPDKDSPSEYIGSFYCGAAAPSFNVDFDGDVVSCFSHATKRFRYGYFDKQTNMFILDDNKIEQLRKLTYVNSDACKNCFAKYYCLGDCVALRIKDVSNTDIVSEYKNGKGRCELIRCIVKENFKKKLNNTKKGE